MSIPDIVNGSFEAAGGLFILNHCRAVLRDKAVAGVSIVSTAFFASWGAWNMWLYGPHLGLWWSEAGGAIIVAANALWIGLMLKYRKGKQA